MSKKILKSFTRSAFFQSIVAWLAAFIMRVIYWTNRWQYINRATFDRYSLEKKPCIVCFWHNRLGLMVYARRRDYMPFNVLISGHSDGIVISKAMGHHGVKTISGSTSKGSADAARKVLTMLDRGEFVAVTPDGPRGPRFSVNPGLIRLAAKAGFDLLPMTYSSTRRKVFNSWDRFILPLPFGRGVFLIGDPIKMEPSTDIRKTVTLLQERLIDITNQADKLCGHEAIPMAEPKKAKVS